MLAEKVEKHGTNVWLINTGEPGWLGPAAHTNAGSPLPRRASPDCWLPSHVLCLL